MGEGRRTEKESQGREGRGQKEKSRERKKKEIFLLQKEAYWGLEVTKAQGFTLFCNRGVQGEAGAREGGWGEEGLVDGEIYLSLWILSGMTLVLDS